MFFQNVNSGLQELPTNRYKKSAYLIISSADSTPPNTGVTVLYLFNTKPTKGHCFRPPTSAVIPFCICHR